MGLGVAGLALGKLAADSVTQASAQQQSIGATQAIFGRYARSVIRESRAADQALGLSRASYRELANVTGATLAGAGIPLKDTTRLTQNLTARGADMAAMFGGTTKEAVEAIGSALRGETDPIERYGVTLKEAEVSALLAARGQDKLTGAALKQATAQARVDLVLKGTARTAGTFAREQNTLAGQSERLTAGFDNLRGKIGKQLLPILTDLAVVGNQRVLPFLSQAVDDFGSGEGKVGAFGDTVRGVVADLKAGRNPLGKIGDDARVVGDAFADAWPEIKAAARELPSLGDFAKVAAVGIEFLADNADILAKNLPVLAAAYGVFKTAQAASNIAVAASPALRLAEVAATRQQTTALRELAAAQRAATGGGVAIGGRRGGSPIATVGNDAAAATGKVSRFGRVARLAGGAGGLGALAIGASASEGALGTLASVGGGALTGFSVGGPIGGAIGAAAGLLLDLASNAGTAEDAATTGAEQWRNYASTLDQVTGATTEATGAMAFQRLADEKVLGTLRELGITNRTAVNAVLGRAGASQQVTAALGSEQTAVNSLRERTQAFGAVLNQRANDGLAVSKADSDRLVAMEQEVAQRQKAIDTVREETGQTERAIAMTRRQAAATREFSGTLKGLPREVRSEIRANNVEPTVRGIRALLGEYDDLSRKDVRTLVRASGLRETERGIDRLTDRILGVNRTPANLRRFNAGLRSSLSFGSRVATSGTRRIDRDLRQTGRVRPNLGPWALLLHRGLRSGQRQAQRGRQAIDRDLRQTGRGARPNLGPFQRGVTTSIRVAERSAGQGTSRINRALSQGTRRARPDLNPFTRFFNQGMGRAAQSGRRGTEQINQALRQGTARSRADLGPFQQSISSGISSARGTASSGGASVGSSLKSGVLAGFSGTASALADAAASAVRSAIAAARAAAQSRSPSRKFIKVGQEMGDGLVVGFDGRRKKVRRQQQRLVNQLLAAAGNDVRSVRDRLTKIADAAGPNRPKQGKRESDKAYARRVKAFEKRERAYERRVNAATKALSRKSKALVENAKRQDRLTAKLERAEERLDSLREARDEYVRSIKQSFLEFGGLAGITEGHLNSPAALNATRAELVKQAERFDTAIRALRGRLNDADLKSLVEAGPAQGLAAAEALVAGGSGVINETNRLQKRLADLGGNLGNRLGLDYHQAGINAQRELVQGIRGDLKQVEKTGDEIAESLLRAFRAKVGIGGKAAAQGLEVDEDGKARLRGSYEVLGRSARSAFLGGLGRLPSQPARSGSSGSSSGSKASMKLTAVMEPLAVKQIASAASSSSAASAAKITQKLDQVATTTRSVQERLGQVAQRVNEPRSTDVRVTVGAGDLSAILAGRAVTKVVRDSKKAGKG